MLTGCWLDVDWELVCINALDARLSTSDYRRRRKRQQRTGWATKPHQALTNPWAAGHAVMGLQRCQVALLDGLRFNENIVV